MDDGKPLSQPARTAPVPSTARATLRIVMVVAAAYACVTLVSERLRFGGTDDRASSAIAESQPSYHRWVLPVWAPGSKATEVALFGVQALLGAGLLGWSIAHLRARRTGDARGVGDPRE